MLLSATLPSIASFVFHHSWDPQLTGTCSYWWLQFQWQSRLPTGLTLRPSLSSPCPSIRAVRCNLCSCCWERCQCFPYLLFPFSDKQDLVYFSTLNLQLWLYNSTKDVDTGVRGVRTMGLLASCLVVGECCLASQLELLSLLLSSTFLHPRWGGLVNSGETVSLSECLFPRPLSSSAPGWDG